MKILHFHSNGQMAVSFVEPLIEAERAEGHVSDLIVSSRKTSMEQREIPYDFLFKNLIVMPFISIRLCKLLCERRPDILISHNTKSSLLPLLSGFLMGVKIRIYFNHGVPYIGYKGILRWILRTLEWLNMKFSTHVLTVSSDMVILLKKINPKESPVLILNGSAAGIDLEKLDSSQYKNDSWRESIQLQKTDVIVLFIGRPEKRKGFECALRLWAEHFQQDLKYKLVLCGPTLTDVLRFLPSAPSNMRCLGFVKNIPEILSNADALILPSYHEGLPYAVLEAMAAKCVVMGNNTEGIRSLIQHQKNGFLIENNNLSEYERIIRTLDENNKELEKIREQGLITAQKYSRKAFLPAYIKFLKDLFYKDKTSE
jgi:N,N'-diacetylbacillosaminyl-diphospho-undecaprenol alpha-1,3-N-acetylgalactosaminyltransferase